ncbi:glycosyltransferase family 2 protein [Noviherbaspirillum galbum]|uniref:Glycosyltransferase family 2 protein n=1 Tax=Noviherbaspirillum galbum TaxID=2709383 RepID=A0A6B3SJB1_9BURK|nr:glycosyltransferase family 2 protein [Noviherbaspirillum galbum]NEX60887.1 glycosyltransferase family 2 protein [Noviherbaspirillum galbum]
MPPIISLVIPVFNEGAMVHDNIGQILRAAEGAGYELELIAVDDGSRDNSAAEIERAAARDPRVRPVFFTRNFGKEAAIHAGLAHAKGDAVVVLDCDLQHPPELIPQMVEFWRKGLCVVDAVKSDRGEEALQDGFFANAFYALFSRFAGLDIRNHSDFKLLDREVVDTYLAFPEKHRFFRGLIGWANYPSVQIPFTVAARAGGTSQWSKAKLLRYAIDNLTSFSSVPLKLITYVGAAILALGAVIGFLSLLNWFEGRAIGGFTTVNLLIIVIGGAIMISLGIIGHYLARLYDEIKARPPYLTKPNRKPPQ